MDRIDKPGRILAMSPESGMESLARAGGIGL